MVAGLPNAGLNDVVLVPEASNGEAQLLFELRQIPTAHIPQLDSFEVVPDALVSVQVRRIAGQCLQVNAFRSALAQELLDHPAAMNGRAIPDDQQLASQMAEQMPQEAHHVLAMEGGLPDHPEELALGGDAADGREVILGEGDVQGGRLAPWGIGPDSTREEGEARFVYPDDGRSVCFGLCLSAGHRWSYQVWMASSLRWVARSLGCWGLQSMARRRRLTWA